MKNRNFPLCLSILLMAVMFLPSSASRAQQTGFNETFDDPTLAGWEHSTTATVVDGVLQIESDGFAAHGLDLDEFKLTLRLRRSSEAGSLEIVYMNQENSRYALSFSEQGLVLERSLDGAVSRLAGAEKFLLSGQWVEVKISLSSGSHTIELDGTPAFIVVDPAPLSRGGLVLRAEGGATGEFDDISLSGLSAAATPVADLTWVRTGGPRGGLGYDVRMDLRLPGVVYVTDAFGGMFMSTDNGVSFFPINTGITARGGRSGENIPVFSLTIDPHDPQVLWAGTQLTGGIFKSVDGGMTWVQINNGVATDRNLSFRGFTVDPTSPDIVYAMAEIASEGWTPDRAPRQGRGFDMTRGIIYKSTDSGENWTSIWEGDNLVRYLWINPRDTNVLYVSTGFFDREAANSDPDSDPGGVGILKSTDGGQTWQVLDQENGLDGLFITSLFMKPDNPDVILAATGILSWADRSQEAGQGGVFLSEDGGETWNKVIDPYTRELPPDYYIMTTVEYCTSDPQVAYADGLAGFFRSTDGGRTWSMLPADFPAGVMKGISIDMMCDPTDPQRLFINFYGGGNALTEDGGQTFVDASHGYTGAQVRGLVVDPQQPARIYTVLRDGVWVSVDGGNYWSGLASGVAAMGEFSELAIDPVDADHLIAGSSPDCVLLATHDAGASWAIVADTTLVAPAGERPSFSQVVFAPSQPLRLYVGTTYRLSAGEIDPSKFAIGLFVSEDGGDTWQYMSETADILGTVPALAIHPLDPETVFASTGAGEIYVSHDGGGTWMHSDSGLWSSLPDSLTTLRYVSALVIDPIQPDHILAGTNLAALYESLDGGATWLLAGTGLPPEGTITSIVTAGSGDWYLATRGNGVYWLSPANDVWTPINNGLSMRAVNRLVISSDGNHLYTATEGMGVFRLDLTGQPPQPVQVESTDLPDENPTQTTSTPAPEAKPGIFIAAAVALLLFVLIIVLWRARRR
jgi:photosystem II stability/assembly factor-like uncharacterized protein